MRALITASFDPTCMQRLERHMSIVHEDWRREMKVYFDGQEFAKRICEAEADILIVEADLVYQDVLDACRLRMIGCCRGDPVNIDRDLATKRGIPVFYAPGRNADAVADLTMAFMLCLVRNVYPVNDALRKGTLRFDTADGFLSMYNKYGGRELGSATIGIIGLGAIGRLVARRAAGFGARILGYDPYSTAEGVTSVDLPTLLRESDILTVHCVVNDDTRGLIGAAELAMMKPTAYVLNLARAAIVDEDALYEALVAGRLAGAGLDVFETEPVQPGNRFLGLPNCLVMPHLGGATVDVIEHQSMMITDSIEAYLAGRRPPFIWNPEVLEADAASRPA